MRVTQSMLTNNTLRNLSNNYSKMSNYMDQLSSGKKISRPSDNPTIAVKAMGYQSQLMEMEQYNRNINEAHHWLDNTDAALDESTKVLQRMRELAVWASNDTLNEQERKDISVEAKALKEQLVTIGNTKVNGKYIFNGLDPSEEPIIKNGDEIISYPTDTKAVMFDVSAGVSLKVNVDSSDIFGKDAFDRIQGFIDELEASPIDQTKIAASISNIDENINDVLSVRAELGARMNRLDLIENRLSSQELLTTDMKAKNENIDYEEIITKFMSQENVHRAALASSSKLIQQTLIDFLR